MDVGFSYDAHGEAAYLTLAENTRCKQYEGVIQKCFITTIQAYAEPRSDCETTSSRNGGGLCFGVPSVPASCSLLNHSL